MLTGHIFSSICFGIDRKIAFVSDRNNGILTGRSLYSLTALMHFATTI